MSQEPEAKPEEEEVLKEEAEEGEEEEVFDDDVVVEPDAGWDDLWAVGPLFLLILWPFRLLE